MAADKKLLIDEELSNMKEVTKSLGGIELVTCVPELVRVHLRLTEHKQLSMCLQFPEDYPHSPLLIELKSRTLGDKLLDRLTKICEEEVKKKLDRSRYSSTFLMDNPLCSCSEEISLIKKELLDDGDELKLKQKNSQIVLRIRKKKYFMNFRVNVPDDYPKECVRTEVTDSNFPELLRMNFQAQAEEISRRCIQPPLKKTPKAPVFTPKPSLQPVCEFMIRESIKRYPEEVCPLCKETCLPDDPQTQPVEKSKEVIRVYCGHIYHFGCMNSYMNTPPFKGGKKCPSCEYRIFHHQWNVSPELAEARWAHKEARKRELDEVMDFLE
ncbi:LOW QUALITY PROTEIN: uncharacterized protein LOC135481891 [Liolophura sinensis]|uniref:LOW QUALITY PROTEIN: uncharacterized protein LOC135481891 n=1 Tax=Liolophura sinensis TaxID=3198878 RepID=UPI0031588E87